jgi:hypothetical protein
MLLLVGPGDWTPRLKTYLEVDFLSSIELSQSESIYPHNLGSLLLVYVIPN